MRRVAWFFASCIFCAAPALQQTEPPVKFGVTVVLPTGLKGQIYKLKDDTDRLPNFKKMKPIGTIYTASLNVPPQDFREGFRGITKRSEWFAIDYTGKFWIEKPAGYGFRLTSDDGSKLYIDGELIIDNDGIHPPTDRTGGVMLSRGIHTMRVSYFQGPRFEVALILEIKPPGEPYRVFSTDEFRPPADFQGEQGSSPR